MGLSRASKYVARAALGLTATGTAAKGLYMAGRAAKKVGTAMLDRLESGQRKMDAAKRADVLAIRKRMGDQ